MVDRFFLELYRNTPLNFIVAFLIPPAMSLNAPVHKNLVDEVYKSIIYANGWEIKELYPFIDLDTYRRDLRKVTFSDKKSFPGAIGFIGLATKDRTYNIDCLYNSKVNDFDISVSRKLYEYFEKITGESSDILKRWRSFQNISFWNYHRRKNEKLTGKKVD